MYLIIFSNTRPWEPFDDQEEVNGLNLIFISDWLLYSPAFFSVRKNSADLAFVQGIG